MTTVDRITVINLDRTPERFATFLENNPSLPVERYAAVDGRLLDRWDCVDDGLITPGNAYKLTALGCTASHIALWRRCVSEDRPLHIAEDDAIFRDDFVEMASSTLSTLAHDWDFVLWSWLFHWPLKVRLAPGLGSTVCQGNQDEFLTEWSAARSVRTPPYPAKLISAAGLASYSISPSGAASLLKRVLPIAGLPAEYVARANTTWFNENLDVELSRHYEAVKAFVSLPCLAFSLHDTAASTISNG